MYIVAIAAQSLDGFVTRHESEGNSFTSAVEKAHFARILITYDCSVFGSVTFDAARDQILKSRTEDRLRIVLTSRPEAYAECIRSGLLEFFDGTPREVVRRLEECGKARCALLGGARVFTEFLEAHLIDEFWITVEPVFFGSGKNLLQGRLDCAMELIAIEELGESVFVAKYRPRNP